MKPKIYGYCRISTGKQSLDRQERNILAAYPDAMIIREVYTGTTTKRPQWTKLLATVREGDTIVFDSVSRMSRNAQEGYDTYHALFERRINLAFIREAYINTSVYKNALENTIPLTGDKIDLVLSGLQAYLLELAKEHIRIAFEQSEKEVMDLRKRTSEGIETARRNGKQIGQRSGIKLTTKKEKALKILIQKHNKDFNGNLTDTETISIINGMDEIKTEDGKPLNPHIGVTKSGNQLCKYINRATFYKYKRELREMGV